MKLYIATSTLNVDNILATESVAPYSFYSKREYGYDTFYKLSQTPYDNTIVLFSKIPHFSVNQEEHNGAPMVVEIDSEVLGDGIKKISSFNDLEVFSYSNVIRLSPLSSKLIFFKVNDLNQARLSCSDSLTNKLGDRFLFELKHSEFNLDSLCKLNINDEPDSLLVNIEKDNRLNKIKGFLWGYYMGVARSVSETNAELQKLQKRVYDIAASMKNSGTIGNSAFVDELSSLDDSCRKLDPSLKRCRKEWDEYLTKLQIPSSSLDMLLAELDPQNVIKNTFMKNISVRPIASLRNYGLANIDRYSVDLNKSVQELIRKDQIENIQQFSNKDIFDLDPSFETCMLAKDDPDSSLFNKYIDYLLWHGNTPSAESLRTNRFEIATEITKKTKTIWENSFGMWDESSVRIYMNDLRQNIKNFTPFELKKEDNRILQALAVYILKGEDYDSIIRYCEDNSVNDYRYVLALWGATIGYVKIPRPIFCNIVSMSTFTNVYKNFYEMLFGVQLQGELANIQQEVSIISSGINQEIHIIKSEMSDLELWQKGIRTFLINATNVRNKQKLQDSLERAFQDNGERMDYASFFFALLNDYESWRTTKGEPVSIWKKMVEHFCPEEYADKFGKSATVKKTSSTVQSPSFFDAVGEAIGEVANKIKDVISPSSKQDDFYFYNSGSTIVDLRRIAGNDKSVSDVLWFFEDMKRDVENRKYYKHIDATNNKLVIDTFCKSKRIKEDRILGPKIEDIRQHFYKKYGI